MIGRWLRNSALVCGFVGLPDPVDFYANHPLAKKNTPDGLISSYIVQSMAKNFDQWNAKVESGPYRLRYAGGIPTPVGGKDKSSRTDDSIILLTSKKTTVRLAVTWRYVSHYTDTFHSYEVTEVSVKGTPIDLVDGEFIFSSYMKLKEHHEELKRVADEALAAQKLNEKKWNLAEDLLGMKRNEFGALEPKVKVD